MATEASAAARDSRARGRLRGAALVALGLACSAFFLALVVRRTDLGEAWRALGEADPRWIAAAVVALQATYVIQALRWRILVRSSHSPARYYAIVVAGVAANNVLPLRMGEVLRARWLARRVGIPSGRAAGSVVRDRAGDVMALLTLLLVALPFVATATWAPRVVAGGLLLLAAVAVLLGIANGYARWRPRERIAARSRWRRILRDLVDELAHGLGVGRMGAAIGLSLGVWGTWAVAAWLVCTALGLEVSTAELLFATAVINLGGAIPSSPGFVGTYQWLAVAALGVAGVAPEPALAFALLLQAAWFVPTTLVGGTVALVELRREAAAYAGRIGAVT